MHGAGVGYHRGWGGELPHPQSAAAGAGSEQHGLGGVAGVGTVGGVGGGGGGGRPGTREHIYVWGPDSYEVPAILVLGPIGRS